MIDLKRQAITVLEELRCEAELGATPRSQQVESFARACLDTACEGLEKLSVDRLAQSANLTDPFEHHSSASASSSQQVLAGIVSTQDSSLDTARRCPIQQRPRDCWESPRLNCPDYVWAEEVVVQCHRILRNLMKHPLAGDVVENTLLHVSANDAHNRCRLKANTERQTSVLIELVQYDVPSRLLQFRTAIEADSVVLKRLYLVKCEYRAPFRAFLEGHQSVLRAPSIELVHEFIGLSKAKNMKRRAVAKEQLTAELENPDLIEALALEQRCEEYEIEMAKQLFAFSELARFLELKRGRLKTIPGVVEEEELQDYQGLLRRLKNVLCRKAGLDTSTGIRPMLLDIQGVARDDEINVDLPPTINSNAMKKRLGALVVQLNVLSKLCAMRNVFHSEQRRAEVDLPASILRGCTSFDDKLFKCHFQDWYSMVRRQHEITGDTNFHQIADELRRKEMEMSLAMAPSESLEVVRQRVEMIAKDREKRFEVLKETIEELCLRELSLYVTLSPPESNKPLSLNSTSVLGVFGLPLRLAGEALPIG